MYDAGSAWENIVLVLLIFEAELRASIQSRKKMFFIWTRYGGRVYTERKKQMFEIGKIPPEILEKIVMQPTLQSRVKREDVILRPKTGEDCSAVDLGGELCILSTDPITGAAKDIGYLAVQINCNDIYSAGAEPMGVLLTVLLPPQSGEELLEEIMAGAIRAAEERGIEILGGHTEVTDAVCKPLLSAAVIGKTRGRRLISTGGAKIGQDVIMTKWAGTEGTAILAHDGEDELRKHLSAEELQSALAMKDFLSVGKESEIAFAHGATAMHDATEGGILGAVWEVAECAGLGVAVYAEQIPLREETRKICRLMGIDPLRLISSGTMIITAENGAALVERLAEGGIPAAVIGKMTAKEKTLVWSDRTEPLEQPKSDALYDARLTSADEKGC